jgi:anti-sigma B factor antagonist
VDTKTLPQVIVTPVREPLHDVAGERVRSNVRAQLARGNRAHIFDLRPLAELDSTTLASLIRVLRIVREAGGSVGLIVDQPNFLRVLSITGLDRVFPVFPDEDAAHDSLVFAQPIPA